MKNIVGNQKTQSYLENALATDEISHAYLFHGISSIGKTTIALEFARRLLCEEAGADDCSCQSCNLVRSSNHPDLHFLDGTGAGIEEMRALSSQLDFSPYQSSKKIAIVTHIDNLSIPALNSFLKTLEEPPEKTTIILTADKIENILPTIISRSRNVRFQPVSEKEIFEHLNLEKGIKRDDARNIAAIVSGRIGLALSLAEDPEVAGKMIADANEFLRVYRSSSITDKISLALKLAAAKTELLDKIVSYLVYFRGIALKGETKDLPAVVSAIEDLARAYELITKNINAKLVMETTLLGSLSR